MAGHSGKLVRGSALLAVARAIVNGLSAISTFILARYLSPDDFGLVAIALTIHVIVSSVTEMSLTQALIQHGSPTTDHLNTAWTLNFLRGCLIGFALCLSAIPIATFYGDGNLVEIMFVLGANSIIGGLINPKLVLLQRQLVFWQDFSLSITRKLVEVSVSLTLAIIYETYWAIVLGPLFGQLANVILSYLIRPHLPRFTFKCARELFSFSAWLSAGQIANTINWQFDRLLIGKVSGQEALGLYSVGSNLAMIPTRETTISFKQTIYPGFSKIQNEPARLVSAYQRAQSFVSMVALPAGVGFAMIADRLVPLVLGPKWIDGVYVIQALASVFALQTLGDLVKPLGMAKGQTKLLFVRDMQMFLIRVPIISCGLILFGLSGVVAGRVICGSIASFVNMTLVKKMIGLTVVSQLHANLRSIFGISVMLFVGINFDNWLPSASGVGQESMQLLEMIFLSAIAYIFAILLSWVLMGRPEGPESEFLKIATKFRRRHKFN